MQILPDFLLSLLEGTGRQTRSGAEFSPYFCSVDVGPLLKAALEDETQSNVPSPHQPSSPSDSIHSSPLSSPPSTPLNEETIHLILSKKRKRARTSAQLASKKKASKKRKVARRKVLGENTANRKPSAAHVNYSSPLDTGLLTEKIRVASSGFVGFPERNIDEETHSLEQVVGSDSQFNFELLSYQGPNSVPILDNQGRVIALFAGHPDDPTWDATIRDASQFLETERKNCSFKENRRGPFPAKSVGISIGGGQQLPMNMDLHTKSTRQVFDRLRDHTAFRRISGFMSSVFATWAPRLFSYYVATLSALLSHDPSLFRPFANSVFAALTVNFGPRTVCYGHRDSGNLPFGWCAIAALGDYDYRKGGHLILWDLKLVIEFPPGCCILIPSAILRHSNTNIGPNEHRYSFTQYTAGGIFRWVERGFKREGDLSEGEKKVDEKARKTRFTEGLNKFSTLDELKRRFVL